MINVLTPEPSDQPVNPLDAIGNEMRDPHHHNRPYVLTNMVNSMDGAIAVDGVSGALGGDADFAVFMALRSVADVIVVGAGTARAEQYKAPSASAEAKEQRQARGQAPRPALAVITASARLDPNLPMFGDPDNRPHIITGADADPHAMKHLESVADVHRLPTASVDPTQALSLLHGLGHRVALLEGGPTLNGAFIEADLIDEWNLSLSSMLVGGSSGRAAKGDVGRSHRFTVSRVWMAEDGMLFVQWKRAKRTT